MKKHAYETPEIKLELVEEDIITLSYGESDTEAIFEEINPEG